MFITLIDVGWMADWLADYASERKFNSSKGKRCHRNCSRARSRGMWRAPRWRRPPSWSTAPPPTRRSNVICSTTASFMCVIPFI